MEHKKRVGVVFSVGGLGDHSFNDSTNEGIKAVEAQGVIVKRVEPANPSEDEMYLREFAENNFDVVVGIGFLMEDSLKKVAMEYPEQKFMGIDMNLDLPNVKSLIFHEKQGSFLVGALAAMVSEGRPVGFVGAAQSPMINAMGEGFAEGARYVDPQIEVVSSYTPGPNPFNDPARGYEIATSMIETQEVEVIYHAAGGTGLGVFQASKEKGTYAIGVDTDQDGFEPGTVITSMIKSLDRVAERELNTILSGDFEAGIEMQNLENGGVRITETPFELGVIGDEKRFREIQEKLISGEIVVEDYRK
ncbi:BMP family ABC transporter substrate-binding protein [Propionigenium maris DSM 9537]|uniref:BMP family ABC transporter substrate-binding protein n=1 Tax=Propionigenium maris DSM 9537 TaxID=1123000 RepID=A0A9W6GKU4_9FUSO|nr:BMP family ABC transporter substrate-binding protein [Propionigenium maris DSM 9537]